MGKSKSLGLLVSLLSFPFIANGHMGNGNPESVDISYYVFESYSMNNFCEELGTIAKYESGVSLSSKYIDTIFSVAKSSCISAMLENSKSFDNGMVGIERKNIRKYCKRVEKHFYEDIEAKYLYKEVKLKNICINQMPTMARIGIPEE